MKKYIVCHSLICPFLQSTHLVHVRSCKNFLGYLFFLLSIQFLSLPHLDMDAEHLKCKKTHDIMSIYLPQARKLLNMLSYLNVNKDLHGDVEIEEYKRALKGVLSKKINEPLSPNIAEFALQSVHRSLYYQCCENTSDWNNYKMNALTEMKELMNRWRRTLLGLEKEEEEEDIMFGMYDNFCKIAGCINFQSAAMSDGLRDFLCPLCVISNVYCDLGWTDLVCPKPLGSLDAQQSCVSKRGFDKGMPFGGCEHIITTKKSVYDKLFAE